MTDALTDRIFNNRYRLVRHLARGGMAEVYLAHDELLDRPVALKMLFPELSVDKSFVERFRREAQAAAKLSHPNIVSVYDWGEEAGTYFIVMEYVDGRTLSSLIREDGPVEAHRAATIAADVAAALAFAHRNDVVHRDVKPGNVLMTTEGQVKVTDFGIARAINTQDNLTQTGTVMGTATYFSPEQAMGEGVDARSDVYSLGVVLYEMVTGRPPFTGDNPVAIATKHVRSEVPAPRSLNATVPVALEAVILQALAKRADQRYDSAETFRADLLRFSQGRAVLARPPAATVAAATTAALGFEGTAMMPAAAATTAVPATVAQRTVITEDRRPATVVAEDPTRRTGLFAALALLLVLVLGGLLFLLYRQVHPATTHTALVAVPDVVNKSEPDAKTTLQQAGFTVQETSQPATGNTQAGTVLSESPKGGTKAAKGSAVSLTVAAAAKPAQVSVPNVVGQDSAIAQGALRQLGLVPAVQGQNDDTHPANRVLSQTPVAGSAVEAGSTVTIVVSTGKAQVTVPDVTGKTETQAANLLGQAGLKVGTVTQQPSDTVPSGSVISTTPVANSTVDKGSSVNLVESSGSNSAPVPDVIGMTQADATANLTQAGFKVQTLSRTDVNPADDGRVVDQNPTSGANAKKGSTVVITVGHTPTGSTSTSSSSTSTTA